MEFHLDPKLPIYVQIIDYIKKKIIVGKLKGGDRLSSVRELAAELKVNPNTIQRVYAELENEKLIVTQRGIGKFVTDDEKIINNVKKDYFTETIEKFIKESKELGFTKVELLKIIEDKFEGGNNE